MTHSSKDESIITHSLAGQVSRRRQTKNWLIAKLITFCGWLVLLTVAVLLWHLLAQVYPLTQTPDLRQSSNLNWSANDERVLLLSDIAHGGPLVTYSPSCQLMFYTQQSADVSKSPSVGDQLTLNKRVPVLCTEQVRVKSFAGEVYVARLDTSGIVRIEKYAPLQQSFTGQLVLTLALSGWDDSEVLDYDFDLSPNLAMLSVKNSKGWRVISIDRESQTEIHASDPVQSLPPVMLPRINQFITLGTKSFRSTHIQHGLTRQYELSSPLSFLSVFPSHRSLFVKALGQPLEKWSLVNEDGRLIFRLTQPLDLSSNLVKTMVHPNESAAFIVTSDQQVHIANHVTGELLASLPDIGGAQDWHVSDNQLYSLTESGVNVWQIENLSGVNTWQALWGKNTYQGYQHSEYIWQTTSGADYYESKHSLVPLVIGSLKASLLALLIAVPLAISAAVYTGYFAPQRLRNWMKPSIETLEAIPSVVLGFIAAIWLAPLAEQFLVSVALFVLLIPFVLILFAFLHQFMIERLPQRFKQGWELPMVAALLLLNGLFVVYVSEPLTLSSTETSDGWALSVTWLENINKSTLVVALALGIAIVPSIYSLAEDAIYDVPASLQKASLALGATRLQTLRKVVLVLAYPGILSAVTLGLGRAFGETMIVLMVTGNTPVADWDFLSGVRTLTANLAIELPESEVGSSHYQILFLSALVLFVFTFLLNTLAELLRQWLRKNYQHG